MLTILARWSSGPSAAKFSKRRKGSLGNGRGVGDSIPRWTSIASSTLPTNSAKDLACNVVSLSSDLSWATTASYCLTKTGFCETDAEERILSIFCYGLILECISAILQHLLV